jgi:hypothetical protein
MPTKKNFLICFATYLLSVGTFTSVIKEKKSLSTAVYSMVAAARLEKRFCSYNANFSPEEHKGRQAMPNLKNSTVPGNSGLVGASSPISAALLSSTPAPPLE